MTWPASIAGAPALAVIDQAIARNRLSHSLLLHGDDIEVLESVAIAIAAKLLRTEGAAEGAGFAPAQHPDCFQLRPAGKMRLISADATRELIGKVQVTGAVSQRKLAIILEADRMNTAAANIFLKTLEEPPANTTILLLTTRPYALLPTIRSRVLHFRFPTQPGVAGTGAVAETWSGWLRDYREWIDRLAGAPTDKRAASDHILTVYGLVARFQAALEANVAEVWNREKEKLPADLDDDEQVAIETGIANGIRARLFADIERETRDLALPRITGGDESARRSAIAAVEKLEHNAGLLRLNLNEAAALEDFLLCSLRLWARRN